MSYGPHINNIRERLRAAAVMALKAEREYVKGDAASVEAMDKADTQYREYLANITPAEMLLLIEK